MLDVQERELERAIELYEERYEEVIKYQNHVDNLEEVKSILFAQYDTDDYEIGWDAGYWVLGDVIETVSTTETDDYIDGDSELGRLIYKYRDYFEKNYSMDIDKSGVWHSVNITGFYWIKKKAA